MNPYAHASDTELWQAFCQGSRTAYAFMYEKYARVLYNYGYKIAQDRQLTEDCIQDLFLILLESRERLSPTDSIKYYLFRALRREIVRKLQLRDRFSSDDDLAFRAVFACEDNWLEAEVSREQVAELLRELNQLPARQKEAIFLKFFDNLSYEEVAGVMGIEQGSAYKVVYKALDNLQNRLIHSLVVLVGSGAIFSQDF